jgi:hypothetical protein
VALSGHSRLAFQTETKGDKMNWIKKLFRSQTSEGSSSVTGKEQKKDVNFPKCIVSYDDKGCLVAYRKEPIDKEVMDKFLIIKENTKKSGVPDNFITKERTRNSMLVAYAGVTVGMPKSLIDVHMQNPMVMEGVGKDLLQDCAEEWLGKVYVVGFPGYKQK